MRYKFKLITGVFLVDNLLRMKERIHKRLPQEFVIEVLKAFNVHRITEGEAMGLLGIKRSRPYQLRKRWLRSNKKNAFRRFRFDDIEYYQPVIFKPPKWLIVLTWFAAFSGRGGAGRAILLSSSQTGAIAVRLRDGKEFYITVTDQMGRTALKGFEQILEMFEKNEVPIREEVKEIRSMGMEIMR